MTLIIPSENRHLLLQLHQVVSTVSTNDFMTTLKLNLSQDQEERYNLKGAEGHCEPLWCNGHCLGVVHSFQEVATEKQERRF